MARSTIALVLAFFVVCSVLVFAVDEDCGYPDVYDRGYAAGLMHKASGLGLVGGVLAFSGSFLSFVTLSGQGEGTLSFLGTGSAGLGIGAVVSGITVALPLASKPQPKYGVPINMSAEERACYLEGYRKAARRKNVSQAAIGSAVGLGAYIGIVFLTGLVMSLATGGEWDPWVD